MQQGLSRLPGALPAPVADAPTGPSGLASFADWQAQCAGAGSGREAWTAPAPPFRVFGNTYYVGTCGIAALLVTSADGNVLLDTGMAQAAPLVRANIERLGYPVTSVKALLSSHEHLDHVGATAELRRLSGGETVALRSAVRPLETGKPYPQDPQAAMIPPFDGFPIDKVIEDGEMFRLGSLAFTAHSTPSHTPGSTSWTWQSCEGDKCLTIAYADSLSTPAAEGYRFADHPDYVAQVRRGFEVVADLPCDILMTPHPGASDMAERFGGKMAIVDPVGCKHYAHTSAARFEQLLASESGSSK